MRCAPALNLFHHLGPTSRSRPVSLAETRMLKPSMPRVDSDRGSRFRRVAPLKWFLGSREEGEWQY